ncbi:unnamed protein product [Lampetra fluviatilis]
MLLTQMEIVVMEPSDGFATSVLMSTRGVNKRGNFLKRSGDLESGAPRVAAWQQRGELDRASDLFSF